MSKELIAEARLASKAVYAATDDQHAAAELDRILTQTADALETARIDAWEEGKRAMLDYQNGARRKVPYPENPYRKAGA